MAAFPNTCPLQLVIQFNARIIPHLLTCQHFPNIIATTKYYNKLVCGDLNKSEFNFAMQLKVDLQLTTPDNFGIFYVIDVTKLI